MADVEKLKFTCCGCFKTFVAKSGQGMRTINCPYCGQVNTINTGEPKPEPEPPVVDLSFPIEQVFLIQMSIVTPMGYTSIFRSSAKER